MDAEAHPPQSPRLIIACRVMEPELSALAGDAPGISLSYLDQSLHRTPQRMAPLIQALIAQADPDIAQVVLGYGLCSNGIAGVRAGRQELIVPKAHDCIALFLGSLARYNQLSQEDPGTYYLTPGWVAEGKDPLGIIADDYTPRVGRENAEWVMREELKHYSQLAMIDTGAVALDGLRERAMANAEFFGMRYAEIQGSDLYLRQLVHGPFPSHSFFRVAPGHEVNPSRFAA